MLQNKKDFTLNSLIAAAYDSYLPSFAELIPSLVKAYDGTPNDDPLKGKVADQMKLLRDWDFRWSGCASQGKARELRLSARPPAVPQRIA